MILIKLLELFCGTKSITKEFVKRGHDCFTVDNDEQFEPDLCIDILELTPEYILENFGQPDVMWCSVPCESFSVSAIGKNWHKGTNLPKSERAELGLEVLEHTVYLIKQLKPKYWFIENPRGKMRKMDIVQDMDRYTVTYCKYGDFRMKPTDLFTNHPNPQFKPPCKNGDPCHVSAPRGSKTGTQGMKNAIDRAKIPSELCKHVCLISEK